MWRRALKHISLPFSQELSVYIYLVPCIISSPPTLHLSFPASGHCDRPDVVSVNGAALRW